MSIEKHIEEHAGLNYPSGKSITDNLAGLHAKTDLLNFDVNGNLIANVTMRTGTYASLITLAGSLGEIGVCTDVQAFIKFNGVAGQAVAYFRNRQAQHCQLKFATTTVPNGASDTRLSFSTADKQGDTFTVSGGYGSLPAFVYDNIWMSGEIILAYNASITSLSLTPYSEDGVGAGTYSAGGPRVYPVFMVSGVGAVVPFRFRMIPQIEFSDVSAGCRWYIAARHNGSSSVSVSMYDQRALTYEVLSA